MCYCTVFFGWKILGSKIGKYILIVIKLAAIGIICAYAVKTARNFHDKWGTNRGMTWRVGWEQFLQFPLRNKLVGVGPEMLVTVYAKMRAATGRNVVSAHCEPLQVLLTQGIVGLCIYLAYWGYLLKLFFARGVWKSEKAIYFFPLAVYWGAVNILLSISGHCSPFQLCGRNVFERIRGIKRRIMITMINFYYANYYVWEGGAYRYIKIY